MKLFITILILILFSGFIQAQTIAGGNPGFESDFSGWTRMRDWWEDPNNNISISASNPQSGAKAAYCAGHATLYNQLYTDITGLTVSETYTLYFYAAGNDADFYIGPTSDVYAGTYYYVDATSGSGNYILQAKDFTASATTMRIWFDFYPNKPLYVDNFSISVAPPQIIAGGNRDFESDFSGWTKLRDWWDPTTNISISTSNPHVNAKAAYYAGNPLYEQLYADITNLTVSEKYTLYFYAAGNDADFYIGPTSDVYSGTYYYVDATSGSGNYVLQAVNFTTTATTMRIWFDFYPNTPMYVDGFSISTTPQWTGNTNTDWNTAANWNVNAVPDSDDNVIIEDVTNDPIIAATTTANCNDLTVASGATLTINSTSETASGSLIVEGASTGNVTYNRWMTYNKWHIVSAPAEGQDIGDLLDNSANSIAYRDETVDTFAVTDYLENTNDWGEYYTTNTGGNFTSGVGYLMRRQTADGTVSFTGTVADADFGVTLVKTGHAWNALGNPFTSALKANDANGADNLITVNSGVLDESFVALYIWDEQASYTNPRNDYKVINHSGDAMAGGEAALSQNYIQVGQGFIVKAKTNSTSFNFTRAMQSHQPTVPFKSVVIEDWADINIIANIEIEDSKISTKTKLKFNSQMTDGLDVGYDAGILKNSSGFNLFTQLAEDNGVEFMLQCLPTQNLRTLEIPLGLDATTGGEISFSIEKNNFTESMIPVLNDKLLDTKFAFKSDDDIYSTTVNDNTKGFGRFSLTFASTTDVEDLAIEKQHFKAWFGNGKINLYGETTGREIVRVYTISGQEISNTRLENTNLNTIELPVRISGIYLIRIEKTNGTEVLKVPVLFN